VLLLLIELNEFISKALNK